MGKNAKHKYFGGIIGANPLVSGAPRPGVSNLGALGGDGAATTRPTRRWGGMTGRSLVESTAGVAGDADWSDVSLLIRGDTIADLSDNSLTVTAQNGATTTTAEKKFAAGSMSFDGVNDTVGVANDTVLDLSSGDWTIECWCYHDGQMPANVGLFGKRATDSGTGSFGAFTVVGENNTDATKALRFFGSKNNSSWGVAITGTTDFPLNQWVHFAVTRSGDVYTIWQNGASIGTTTVSGNLMTTSDQVTIGLTSTGSTGATNYWDGYIEDFRVTKGVARDIAAGFSNGTPVTGGGWDVSFPTTATTTPTTTNVPTIGVLSLPELLQKRYGDPVPAPDGLTAATAATSAAQILLDYPSSGDGIYYIQDGSSTKQVYCDMTNDGGGWMLYSSFASDNTLDATNYPAWNGNRLLYADVLGTNAATYGYASIGATITSYHDGTTNNFAGYTQQPQHLGVFASGSPVGGIGATTWNGPSTVSKLRIAWGRGSASYAGGNNTLEINGSQVDSIAGSVSKVASYSFNPAGSSAPYFGVKESSIVGISYVYMR